MGYVKSKEYYRLGVYPESKSKKIPPIHTCLALLILAGLTFLITTILFIVMPWLFGPCQYSLMPIQSLNSAKINTIAFGSCASSEHYIPILNDIQADLFVFLGDNVYADTKRIFYMQWMYNRLSCRAEFQGLVERVKYILAIWDDHDYGNNNIGIENPIKYESQSTFLDFWKIPRESERRRGHGIYGSYRFRMPDNQTQTFSIIMPDLRFFRDPLVFCKNGEYYPRTDCYCPTNGTMLGSDQWSWLEKTVNKSQQKDSLTIIASSLQFGHAANGYESWTNFPRDRERLKKLLDPSKSLVISGDVHWGEISILDGLVDATSSGLSEVDHDLLPNANRVGSAMPQQNYGLIDLRAKTVSIFGLGNQKLLSVSFGSSQV